MGGLTTGLVFIVLIGGSMPWVLYEGGCIIFSSVVGIFTVLLVLLYEEQMDDLDESFPLISELSPAAMVLVNQDTPLATATTAKSRLVEETAEAKRDGYEARVYIKKIEAVFPWVSTYDFEG